MAAVNQPRTHLGRWSAAIAVVLSFAAGATDAFAFLQLGGIFTANMTGNLILAGLTQRPGYASTLLGASVAVIVFAAGVYLSLRIARSTDTSRRGQVIVLAGTVAAQAAVLVGWLVSPQPTTLFAQLTLIVLSALAMAGQTSVARRIETGSGVTTTFVTGTLTNLMASFADGKRQDRWLRVTVILTLVLGALCGSLLMRVDTALGAALPLIPSIIGLVLLMRASIITGTSTAAEADRDRGGDA